MKKIVLPVSNGQYTRLQRQKALDGYKDKAWLDWIVSKAHPRIQATEMDSIQAGTRSLRKLWYNNIGHNLAYIRREGAKTLRDLAQAESSGSALVVGAGPSIEIHKHLDMLKNSDYDGTIISSDRMLKPLIKNEIIPDFVTTVDGTELIIPFYKNKYFREHVKDVKILLHFTANPKLVKYLYSLKADIYWYIIHSEQQMTPESETMQSVYMTMSKHNPDGLQTLLGGGNCGIASWIFGWVVLKKNPICLIGFDMGYPDGTRLEKTYYYSSVFKVWKERGISDVDAATATKQFYKKEYNPIWKSYAWTDVVFRGYRDIFYSYLDNLPSDVMAINCTEGGTLNHRNLLHMTLADALKKYRV